MRFTKGKEFRFWGLDGENERSLFMKEERSKSGVRKSGELQGKIKFSGHR